MLIRKAEMMGREGNNYIVQVIDLKTDVPAAAKDFVFDPQKVEGAEIIDLR